MKFYFSKCNDSYDGINIIRILLFNFNIFEIWKGDTQIDITLIGFRLGIDFKKEEK